MNREKTRVANHFENISAIFDSIYKGEQESSLHTVIDILFRKDILERRRKLIIDFCGDIKGKDILDIGCGSGRYAVMLAKNRPNSILGLDISPLMIDLAKQSASANNVAEICRFETDDFFQKKFKQKFDIVIAAGVFDYIRDPQIFLLKIKDILKGKALFSFPAKWTVLTPLRRAWLQSQGCPSYYYSHRKIKNLFEQCGLKIDSIRKIGSFLVAGNYIVVCSA